MSRMDDESFLFAYVDQNAEEKAGFVRKKFLILEFSHRDAEGFDVFCRIFKPSGMLDMFKHAWIGSRRVEITVLRPPCSFQHLKGRIRFHFRLSDRLLGLGLESAEFAKG